jgi:glycosyltransferase involved in cell wall biosynthesis
MGEPPMPQYRDKPADLFLILDSIRFNQTPQSLLYSMSNPPLISVIMPVYNAGKYLPKALDSVLAQTLADFEFIIIDDGSTDASVGTLDKYAAQDSRIRLIRRPNTGYVIALNEALALASGEFIARMDADDICLPKRFERQSQFLCDHADIVLVGGRVEIIDEGGRLIIRPEVPCDDASLQAALLEGRTLIGHPTVMVRREIMQKCGGYDVNCSPAEDLDMWLRVGEVGKLANLPELVLQYRQHAQSVSSTKHDQQVLHSKQACERAWKRRGVAGKLCDDIQCRPASDRKSRFEYQVRYGWWAFNSAQRLTAMRYAFRAICLQPLREAGWKLLACSLIKPMPRVESVPQ